MADGRKQLLDVRHGVARGVGDGGVQRLISRNAQVLLARVRTLGASEERARQFDEEAREHVGGLIALVFAVLGKVVEGPADIVSNPGIVPESGKQNSLLVGRLAGLQGASHLLPLIIVDRSDMVLADTADGPRRRVLDLKVGVLHELQHHVQRLRQVRHQYLLRRSLEERAEGKSRCLAAVPVGRGQVLLDKRYDILHHLVLHGLRDARKAGRR
mmetsp:Transcript_13132/g.28314  ORF Transcript_13132/g.28314 Transcript_13132/m.28314 type:complete len:214 (+) Transcript_13132:1489-2130(+)